MSGRSFRTFVFSALFLAVSTGAADAYIGPGSGLSAIGSLFGVLAALFLALVGFVWYPIKRLFKRVKGVAKAPAENEPAAHHHETE